MELRHMNEEVSGKQKDGDAIKDLEHFRKQYAMVLVQLRDANDQVSFIHEHYSDLIPLMFLIVQFFFFLRFLLSILRSL